MHRCWLDTDTPPAVHEPVALSREESDHALRTLRMQPGDALELIAAERLFAGEIASVENGVARVRIVRELPSPEPAVRK